jgi:MoaA/NifB/PqqE/SkfB family radical SAM enzyme/Tfp pilus assembly protein PilF
MSNLNRNDPCPCGSGKKYKQCCLKHDEALATSKRTESVFVLKAIQEAIQHHQAGRLPQAEAIYQQILKIEPNHPDALHFLGVIAHQQGKAGIAVELIGRAINVNPSEPMYYSNLGAAFEAQSRLDEAASCHSKALELKPDYADAHSNLGAVFYKQGKLDEAISSYRKALAFKPDFAQARINLEMAIKDQEMVAAVKDYREALLLKPDLAEIHNRLGLTFQYNQLGVQLQSTIDHAFYPRVPVISLELTNNCNLKCPYCANGTLTRPKTYIQWALLEKIVDECAKMQYDLAWLHGVGEPLLWDRLEDVISLIKRKGAGTGSFGTNGTLLYPDRVKRLIDAGLDSIYVSIDTLDPEIYKNTRGGKLEKVIQNIQEMIGIVPSTFQITVALMNHKDHQVTGETIKQFHRIFGHQDNVRTNLVENALFPSAPGDYRACGEQKSQTCWAPVNYLFIALDGRTAICCLDQDVLHSLGNVMERSISDIWYDPKTQTTFRNVALGVHECPDACTQKCVLLPPRKNVNSTRPGLGLPFEKASQFADILLQNGDNTLASSVFRDIAQRDPTNPTLRAILEAL